MPGPHTYYEKELIEALKQGEPKAYQEIYHRYVRQVCFFVDAIINNTLEAEDIAAEALIKTFDKAPDFETVANFKFYLFRIARNASLNYLKKEKRLHVRQQEWNYLAQTRDPEGEEVLLQSEVLQTIHAEIERLPLQVKEVIKLSVIEGKSLTEIASLMGIAYKTVQNHKTRGVNMLRIALLKNKLIDGTLLLSACLFVLGLEE